MKGHVKSFLAKRGIKPPEEDTVEQNRTNLSDSGYTVKDPSRKRQEKFSAYGQLARDKNPHKFYAPPGYESYARPEEDLNNLNRSELNDESQSSANNEPDMKKEKKKRGLFGRKKSSKEDSTEPFAHDSNANTYDPYAAVSNVSGIVSDPYKIRSTSDLDAYNNTNASSDPYGINNRAQSVDPYHSNSSSSNSYSNFNNSSMNKDPYSSYTTTDNNNTNNDKYKTQGPHISHANPYGAGSTSDRYNSNANGYGNVGYSSTKNSSYEENRSPMYSRNTTPDVTNNSSGPIASSTRNQKSSPYSDLNKYNNYSVPAISGRTSPNSSSNPYASLRNDNYNTRNRKSVNPYTSVDAGTGYNSKRPTNPYAVQQSTQNNHVLHRTETNLTTDLNRASTDLKVAPSIVGGMSSNISTLNENSFNNTVDLNETLNEYNNDADDDLNADFGQRKQQLQQLQQGNETDDIINSYGGNDTFTFENQQSNGYENLDAEVDTNRGYQTFEEIQREEEQRQQEEEEEAVDELKQQIRFTKQSSVASTRNTLKMAQEAEMSGMNTLGLLGHQSEKLNNIERNLDLMKVQNSIADEKVAELQKLNRSLLAVHVSNPFNSKRRKQRREEHIKNQKIQEKMMMEETNKAIIQSTSRIENAMDENGKTISDIRDRYQRQDIIGRAKRYQFENDEEDDEMEVEIDRNLDQIQQVSGRLKKLAIATGEEIDSQQGRIINIEDNTDDLDIKIHMNTSKLSTIK